MSAGALINQRCRVSGVSVRVSGLGTECSRHYPHRPIPRWNWKKTPCRGLQKRTAINCRPAPGRAETEPSPAEKTRNRI